MASQESDKTERTHSKHSQPCAALGHSAVSALQTPWVVQHVCVDVSVERAVCPCSTIRPRGWVWENSPNLGRMGLGEAQPLLSTSVQAGGRELRAWSGRPPPHQAFWDDGIRGAAAAWVQARGRRLHAVPSVPWEGVGQRFHSATVPSLTHCAQRAAPPCATATCPSRAHRKAEG